MPEQPSFSSMLEEFKPHTNSKAGELSRSLGVTASAEFERIYHLPRRKLEEMPLQTYADIIYRAFKTPGGTMYPYPLQAATIVEAYDYGGAFCGIPVGGGKSLPSFLIPSVIEARRPLLIVPANLVKKTIHVDLPFYRRHWRIPDNLVVVSYAFLSSHKRANFLEQMQPDYIACDEAQHLRYMTSARTKRFFRYLKEHPATVLVFLSGSMTRQSLRDYAHILHAALPPQMSPLPYSPPRLDEWADAIDPHVPEDKRVAPGALEKLCEPGESVWSGFRRRLVETPAVILSTATGFAPGEEEPGLEIHEIDPGNVPVTIMDAFRQLRSVYETPGGEEISDGMSMWRHATSLALGYYTRWVWPNGEPDIEWMRVRKDWHRFVRETLRYNRSGYDSIKQVANACEAGEYNSYEWEAWKLIRERYGGVNRTPPTEAVWISDWLVQHAADYVRKFREKTLVWVRAPAIGAKLAQVLGVPYFGAGDDGILNYADTCVLSMKVHGTGKNLQDRYYNNVFVGLPSGNDQFQQTMGRTHRTQQPADTVRFYAYMHCREMRFGFEKALAEASYVQGTTGESQKLTKATINYSRSMADVAMLDQDGHPLWTGSGN